MALLASYRRCPHLGASRLFAFHGSDEIVVEVFLLEWPDLLLLFALLGPLTGTFVVVGGLLAFTSFTAEERADRFFSRRVVGHYIHQLIDGLRAIPA